MIHPIYRIVSVQMVAPYTLRILFDDGTDQTIDFLPILSGPIYGPLRDRDTFDQVYLDREVKTIVWPNGADFDPATLHDWPDYVAELTERAGQWDLVPA